MTYKELSDAFDVYSNRYAEAKQDRLMFFDEYEKSLFLTQAADEIVKELLPFYDRNEKIKKQLLPITTSAVVSIATGISDVYRTNLTSLLYELPANVLYVVVEFLKDPTGVILDRITPIGDDEIAYSIDSPFRCSVSRHSAYRGSLSIGDKDYAEIITNVPSSASPKYFLKYIEETPSFIVTDTLLDASIKGVSTNSDITLEAPLQMLHNKILNRAILIGYESKNDEVNAKVARQKDSEES
jgi:hypothetical protein